MEIATKRSTRKRGPKQGPNVRLVRTSQNMTQEALAHEMNMSQSKISALELQDEIEADILKQLAKILGVPVEFLKNFVPEEFFNEYTINNNTFSSTSAENSNENINQQIVAEQENNITYNYPIDKLSELYDKLLLEKDKHINRLEEQINDLKKQVEELKAAVLK